MRCEPPLQNAGNVAYSSTMLSNPLIDVMLSALHKTALCRYWTAYHSFICLLSVKYTDTDTDVYYLISTAVFCTALHFSIPIQCSICCSVVNAA